MRCSNTMRTARSLTSGENLFVLFILIFSHLKEPPQIPERFMGAPWFKMKDLAKQHGIIALSSNYALYADMSNRVMSILRGFSPDQEVYSIDESFLDLSGFQSRDLVQYGQQIRKRILKWTGLPVCVGIGATKTLAKLANHCAKKRPVFHGVCNFNAMSHLELEQMLSELPVGEIWGVGGKLAPKLEALGFKSVLDLKRANPELLRRQFSVVESPRLQ